MPTRRTFPLINSLESAMFALAMANKWTRNKRIKGFRINPLILILKNRMQNSDQEKEMFCLRFDVVNRVEVGRLLKFLTAKNDIIYFSLFSNILYSYMRRLCAVVVESGSDIHKNTFKIHVACDRVLGNIVHLRSCPLRNRFENKTTQQQHPPPDSCIENEQMN